VTQTQPAALTAQALEEQFAAATAEAARIAGRLSEAQGRWSDAPGRWSIAQCLDHLTTTTRVYLPTLETAVAAAPPPGATPPPPYVPGPIGRWLIASMEPPPKRRMTAPRAIKPGAAPPPIDTALREFVAAQDRLQAVIARARTLDLGRVRIRSPLAPVLRMKLGTALGFLAAHERRHLWQAEQVRAAPGFPRA